MNYFEAMWIAIYKGWFDAIQNDAVSGNGFQITWYGLKLLAVYLLCFVIRLVIALLFPVTALLVMHIESRRAEREKKWKAKADADL